MANSKSEKHLTTTWGAQLSDLPDPPWSEYPRPQLRRNSWKTLNGLWRCRIAKEGTDPNPKEMLEVQESDQEILVPFCLESKLGGVQRKLDPEEELWYHRSFEVEKLETSRHGARKCDFRRVWCCFSCVVQCLCPIQHTKQETVRYFSHLFPWWVGSASTIPGSCYTSKLWITAQGSGWMAHSLDRIRVDSPPSSLTSPRLLRRTIDDRGRCFLSWNSHEMPVPRLPRLNLEVPQFWTNRITWKWKCRWKMVDCPLRGLGLEGPKKGDRRKIYRNRGGSEPFGGACDRCYWKLPGAWQAVEIAPWHLVHPRLWDLANCLAWNGFSEDLEMILIDFIYVYVLYIILYPPGFRRSCLFLVVFVRTFALAMIFLVFDSC